MTLQGPIGVSQSKWVRSEEDEEGRTFADLLSQSKKDCVKLSEVVVWNLSIMQACTSVWPE